MTTSTARIVRAALFAVSALTCAGTLVAQAPKPTPDVLVFTNGDQLTGKLERAVGDSAVFKSDMAGELTVPFSKIKSLKTGGEFIAIGKGPLKTAAKVTGTVDVADSKIVVTPPSAAPKTLAPSDIAFLVDDTTYQKELARQPGFFRAWNGTITGGATIVRSTQNATTLTAGIALVRSIPTVAYLPARNRTTLDITESYGKQTSPILPPTSPPTPATVVLTSIFHADAERDEYFSPRLYALADTSFDHNYSQGLSLQQVYGGGIGWTPLKSGKQQLDVKADVHYEEQRFLSATPGAAPSPSINLFGSTLAETYKRNLPRKIVFTETGNYLPAWTDSTAYSASVTAALSLPVFKRLSATVSTTDNYLNDPALYYKKNSYQFVTGVTYSLR